jgi:hypothetical protein
MGPLEIVIFTVIVCSLGAVPLFFVARRFVPAELAAGAATLYFFIPTIPLFLPSSNTMTPFFALTGLWLVLRSLDNGFKWTSLWCGLYLGLLFLYEPIPFALALFLIPWIYRAVRRAPLRTLAGFGLMTLGLAAVATTFSLLTNVSFLRITGDALNLGLKFNEKSHRGYWPYLLENVRDFMVAVGTVGALLWVRGMWKSAGEIFARQGSAIRRIFVDEPSAALFVFSFSALFAVLIAAGMSRGEVDRLWIFLTPFAVVSALWGAERLGLRRIVPTMAAWLFAEWLIRSSDELNHWFF